MSKKILSLVLVVVMLMLAVPMTVFSAIAAGLESTYTDLQGAGKYVGYASGGNTYLGNQAWADSCKFKVYDSENITLWNCNPIYRGIKYSNGWSIGILSATDSSEFYPFDTLVPKQNMWYVSSKAPATAVTAAVPMIMNQYNWVCMSPSVDWNISLRYTVEQAGYVSVNSNWLTYLNGSSYWGLGNMSTNDAEAGIAILHNGQFVNVDFCDSTNTPIARTTDFVYSDVSTWQDFKECAKGSNAAGTSVFNNVKLNVKPGDTLEMVIKFKKASTTVQAGQCWTAFCPNFNISYQADWAYADHGASGTSSQMTSTVWGDVNLWTNARLYHWMAYKRNAYNQNTSERAFTTLAEYEAYLKKGPIVFPNEWSAGTITEANGYSPAVNATAIQGYKLYRDTTDTGYNGYREDVNKFPSYKHSDYYMASADYSKWVDDYLNFVNVLSDAGGEYSYAGERAWSAPGGLLYWNGSDRALNRNRVTTNQDGAFAYTYTSAYAGIAQLQLASFMLNGADQHFDTHLAVAVNGKIVWPANATLNDKSNWLAIDNMTLDQINEALLAATPAIKAGDQVSLCVGYSNVIWSGNIPAWTSQFDVKVYVENAAAPTVTDYSVGFSNGQYSLNFTVAAAFGSNATVVGATHNGVEYAGVRQSNNTYKVSIPVAAKEMGDAISITPFAKLNAKAENWVVGSASSAVSVKSALYTYIDNVVGGDESNEAVTTAKTAAALLNYGAAAQAFFGYNDENPVNGTLNNGNYDDYKDYYGIGSTEVTGTYTDTANVVKTGSATVTYNSVTLIAGNEVSIRVIFNGNLDGYTLKTNNGDYAINDCGDGTSSAVIPVNIANWDADYTMYVSDGTAQVSDILTYGVSTYYARMQGVDANLDVLLNAMMALYETVGA